MTYIAKLHNYPITWEIEAENEAEATAKAWELIKEDLEPISWRSGGYLEIKEKVAKVIYYFDCLEDLGKGNQRTPADFKSEKEAKQLAFNYEATLIKKEFNNQGEELTSKVIYDPWELFN